MIAGTALDYWGEQLEFAWRRYRDARKRLKVAKIKAKTAAIEAQIAALEIPAPATMTADNDTVKKHDRATAVILQFKADNERLPTSAREVQALDPSLSTGTAHRALQRLRS